MISRRPNTRSRGRVSYRVIASGGSPPAAPTLTAPTAGGSANVFNGVATTVSATADGTTTQVQWILDPSGAATVVATDNASPFTQSWTPTGVSDGSHTLIARASNAFGSTDSAPLTISVGEVLHTLSAATCLRAWQTDFGLTLGGTPLASGTGPPPALTLTGSIATNVFPSLRVEIQTTGADGVATYRYGNLNDGTTSGTWIESGKVVPGGGGTYNAIGALAGLVFNWPVGSYTNDNVYQGTCSSWTDQQNSFNAVQAIAGKQPLILLNTTFNRPFLRFDGTDDTLNEAALDLPAPATTPTYVETAFVQRTWTANKSLFAATAGNMQLVGQTATPQLKMFNSSFSGGVGATLGSLVRGETLFTGSVNDRLKIAATNSTGTSAGNNNAAAGWNISSSAAANFGAMDIYAMILYSAEPSAGEKTSFDTVMGAMYTGIGV